MSYSAGMDRSARGILILGAATSFIGEAVELAEASGIPIAALVTNLPDAPEAKMIRGYQVLQLRDLPPETRGLPAICILGTPEYRRIVLTQATDVGLNEFITLVHPTAFMAQSVQIGRGCFVNMRATIASGVVLGDHVVINRGALIGHDNAFESFTTVAPGVITGGMVRVREGAYLGIGATILPEVTVGRNAVVAGGAVVTGDVPDHTLVAGVPATVKRENIPGYRGK